MKKLIAFLIVLLLALATATYFYYTHWRSSQQASSALPYVPQSAALVYEVNNFGQQWEAWQFTPLGQDLSTLSSWEAWQQNLAWLEELVGGKPNWEEVPLTVSVHGLGEEQLGYIFYFNTHDTATQAFLGTVMAQIREDTTYNKSVRSYAGCKITEIGKQGTHQRLAYLKRDQHIIASFSPWLIEDVVRALASKAPHNFLCLKKSENKQGSLYINFGQLPQLLRTFLKKEGLDALSTSLASFTQASQLHLKNTSHHLLLNGFAEEQTADVQHWTHTLAGQATGTITLAPYLPQSTVMLQHFAFSDPEQLFTAFQQYRAQHAAGNASTKVDVHLLATTLYPLLQGEMGHCLLEAGDKHPAGQLLFMKVNDTQAFIEALQGLNLLTASSRPSADHPAPTYALQAAYFQSWLPGQLFPTFEAQYLTQAEDCIVLANSQAALQTSQEQYRQGKTWAHASASKAWLESALDQAHYSLMIDVPKARLTVSKALKPAWQPVFEACTDLLQKWSHASLQLLHEPAAGCYMSVLWASPLLPPLPQEKAPPVVEQPAERHTNTATTPVFQAEAPLIIRPWLVKSHQGASPYWLLQDASYQVYFLEANGQLLWKKALEGPITTNVFEVDFYSNNKVQYLLATDSKLHLLDYYGREVSKYPHPLPQTDAPVRLNVVDYNREKNYRFLLATAQGDIYLKDKHYRPLPDWNPLALGHAFAAPPFHSRVQGKDYFWALQTQGTVQALTRKGHSYPGFPVTLQASTSQSLLVRKGKTEEDTFLIVLTEAGQRIHLGLDGQTKATLQLPSPDEATRFVLCPDSVSGRGYVIMRHDKDQVALIDEEGTLLFELPHKVQQCLLQYYDFGDTQQCYVFTDLDKQCTYLYDHAGQPLQEAPLRNSHAVRLLWAAQEKQLTVYTSFDNVLAKQVLAY
ncbi:MAG: hypothetical protein ROO73_00535 [Roseivirga sp.]